MPKRWRVVYSGVVYDRFSIDSDDSLTRAGQVDGAFQDVEADEVTVRGGALVFSSAGVVAQVFAPGSYWFVRLTSLDTAAGP